MRKCPECHHTGSFTLYGPIVYGTMSVEFDEESDSIANSGPCVASTIIKRGKEIEAKGAYLTCPRCNFSGNVKLFPLTLRCQWTGKSIEDSVMVCGIRVSKDVEGEVRAALESELILDHADMLDNLVLEVVRETAKVKRVAEKSRTTVTHHIDWNTLPPLEELLND